MHLVRVRVRVRVGVGVKARVRVGGQSVRPGTPRSESDAPSKYMASSR